MKVEHFEEVVKITIDEEAAWARSEFPHPLVTLDFNNEDELIAVSAIDVNSNARWKESMS